MKRLLLTIGSLALVAVLGVTMTGRLGVDAQTATPTTGAQQPTGDMESNRDAYLTALAEKLGVTPEVLQIAIDETNEELGVNGLWKTPGGFHESNRGNRGFGNHFRGEDNRGGGMFRGADVDAAATFLGITEDELKTELRSGKTFLQIATDHGKSTDDVRAFLIDQATTAIDRQLEAASGTAAPATPVA